jgi:hypothetical protein
MESSDAESTQAGDVEQELRTLSFRMREIQRLLNMRVEQENRRLEAEGLEPVPERSFKPDEPDQQAAE